MSTSAQYFAITFYGLEQIAKQEVSALPQTEVTGVQYRRVQFTSKSKKEILNLRTVDDVFVSVASWSGIIHTREGLKVLAEYASNTSLIKAISICREARKIPEHPEVSITVNFVGSRNYSTKEIKAAVKTGFQTDRTINFVEDDHLAHINIRIFIEHQQASVGVRLCQHPLRIRPYNTVRVPGAVKPPVAAAMIWLCEAGSNDIILDPCCGSGTILAEAVYRGCHVIGGDIVPKYVKIASNTLESLGITGAIQKWDACQLPVENNCVDRVVTNLPWGRQTPVQGEIDNILNEISRVLKPEGIAVLLINGTEFPLLSNQSPDKIFNIRMAGTTATLVRYTSKSIST